jgi:hypothetical protein
MPLTGGIAGDHDGAAGETAATVLENSHMETKVENNCLVITIPIGQEAIRAAKFTNKGDKKLLASAMFTAVPGHPDIKMNVSVTAPIPAA